MPRIERFPFNWPRGPPIYAIKLLSGWFTSNFYLLRGQKTLKFLNSFFSRWAYLLHQALRRSLMDLINFSGNLPHSHCTKNEFFIKDFFSNCDQIHRKLGIWSHLLKWSWMENFIFCAVFCKAYFKVFCRIDSFDVTAKNVV